MKALNNALGMDSAKAAMISAMILEKRLSGMSIRDAFDAVIGEGAYSKLAGEIYDELRAKPR